MFQTRLLKTTSFRLTLIYAGLFLGSVLALFGFIYWATAGYMSRELDNVVQGELAEILNQAGGNATPEQLAAVVRQRTADNVGGTFILLQAADGRRLAGNLPAQPTPTADWMDLSIPSANGENGEPHRMRALGAILSNGAYLLVGEDAFQLDEVQELTIRAFGIGLAATLLLALLGGVVMSASLLKQVEGIARTSHAIMAGDLSQRIQTRGTDDEFDHLATTLNSMLDRITTLMQGLQQVTNDIAHDLRTPLSRLRQRLELTLRQARSVPDYEAAISRSIHNVDAILETFAALLRIAQIEAGPLHDDLAIVDLSEALETVAELYASTAEERSQAFATTIPPDLRVRGDRQLLIQMLANLVDNAIRHTPEGGRIALEAHRRDGTVEVIVADNGPGIPEEERARVFQRFYRLEASRTTEGNGLGLSLVAAIAARHQLEIELADNQPGLRVSIQAFACFPGGSDKQRDSPSAALL